MLKVIEKSGKEWVKRAMLNTKGKTILTPKLNDLVWYKMLKAKHSPICEYEIYIEALVPERVYSHLVRHERIGKYVATSRPDIEGFTPQNKYRFLGLSINAKRLIEMCEQRLCNDSWHETREFMNKVVDEIPDKILKKLCTRPCVKLNTCIGKINCGFMNSEKFKEQREFFENGNLNIDKKSICKECGSKIIESYSGLKCSNCNYFECF